MDDKLHEECGVFGIYAPEGTNVAKDIYYGLIALQHRGQESAGIAVCDTAGPAGNISTKKGMGLVSEVFSEESLSGLVGNIGVGHVRYSTTGGSKPENAQPIAMNYIKGTLALVHNGNIVNAEALKEAQMYRGQAHYTSSDTEVLAYEIVSERVVSKTIEEAVKTAALRLRGGYACLIMSPRKLIGIRDPYGLKPLVLGRKGDAIIFSSESAAIKSIGGELIRDIAPGEIFTITEEGMVTSRIPIQEKAAHCIFEYIYFARNDSIIDGIPVHEARLKAGRALAKRNPIEADIVTGVPDSGLAAAQGYSYESGIPFALAFHKNSYIGRSFIKPTDEERKMAVHMKLNVLENVVKDKRIVIIDDSIVRGNTMRQIIEMLRSAGAKEVHVRISSPPFLYPCYYGTDVPSSGQLIASNHNTEEVRENIGADSLEYLAIEDFSSMVGDLPLCRACFDNNYPV
ncbi:MAG: amidophosphoribosyltransferase [Lachnospiraceae bacterium]|nr:amidophosphoribosyltransferase [Lachnospiraceae bacterium]MBR4808395.1 amidophosphoribosyltransferase [Lachnospiraceae bacterium]